MKYVILDRGMWIVFLILYYSLKIKFSIFSSS